MARHLALLNRKLVDIAEGRLKRLIVTMPPRHGKSEAISRYFPAWYLGTYPDRRIILTSHHADFAAGWGRKVRDVINEFGREFFGIEIRSDSSAADRWDIVGREGGMVTAGVGGPITGRGANVFICDDYLKNAAEANSPTIRENQKDWWRSTAYTRLEPDGAAVIVATRWHEDDLIGWLLSGEGGDEPWEVINLPALAEEDDPLGRKVGEALWPERFDVAALNDIKKDTNVGEYYFAAMYQCRPQPAEGGRFKRAWFRYWEPVEDGSLYRLHLRDSTKLVKARDCRRFGTVDLALSLKQTADYTVIAAWAVTRDSDLILLDLMRERIDDPEIVPSIARMAQRHRLDYVGVEDVQFQSLILRDARRKGLTVTALKADRDKVTRAIPATVRMESEQLFLPQHHHLLATIESELLTFPTGTHDDIVDVVAYAAREVIYRGNAPETDDEKAARREREAEEMRKRQEAYLQPSNEALWR